MSLTAKQEAFALAVFKGASATEAYRVAYAPKRMADKTINEAACRLLKNGKVSARLAELRAPVVEAAQLTVERTLREVAGIVTNDPRRFFKSDGTIKAPLEWDDAMAAAVSSIKAIPVLLDAPPDEEQEPQPHGGSLTRKRKIQIGHTYEIKFWDKNAAIDKAMRHLGLFEKDNVQRKEDLVLQVNLIGTDPAASAKPVDVVVRANLLNGRGQ